MIWFFFGFLIAAFLFFHIGWYGKQLLELTKSIKGTKPVEPEQAASVTMGAYKRPNENYQSLQIVNPKTPQQLEYEAQMQVRRDNNLTQ